MATAAQQASARIPSGEELIERARAMIPALKARAAQATAMTHIAIQEVQDGRAVDWAEHVTDADYGA